MAMMGTRDKPTYYNIVDGTGKIIVHRVSKSKVFKVLTEKEKELGEKLFTQLMNNHNI